MKNIIEKKYGDISVVERSDYKWGVLDTNGNEIVPFGTYDWIDTFDQGLARVKIGRLTSLTKRDIIKWGIINTEGKVVLPVEYDEVWNFATKHRYSTKTVKDGIAEEVYLHDLNPELPNHNATTDDDTRYKIYDWDEYYEQTHYSEYAGSYAQEFMGYSDEDIDDIFDGDPDAYWNID